VYWDVHISDSGEYVHAAPWDVGIQGSQNVSHGCVNLSPERAETFFRFSHAGDIVRVVNGPRPPAMGDHGVMDWSFGPSTVSWTPAKVAHLITTVDTIPTTSLPSPPGAPYYGSTVPPDPTATPAPPAVTTPATTEPPATTTTTATTAATPATTTTTTTTTATTAATTAPTTAATAPPTSAATTGPATPVTPAARITPPR
ncbi:MAG: L,D-transpeptidase, partial [Acidimicrobiales bacterium]